jgi:hypothetical protein
MTAQSFILLVLGVCLGVLLALVISRRLISWQHVATFALGLLLGVMLGQYVLTRRIFGQVDHATDKCLLYDARMTQCGPAAWRGSDFCPNLPSEPT